MSRTAPALSASSTSRVNRIDEPDEALSSGVSWGAVIGGSLVAAALSLSLLALGAGIGLSSVSPWSNVGASGASVARGSIVWLILVEIIASAMGGYLAGRLRTKWVQVHTDEVFFRDTAHGFLVWSLGLVISAAFLGAAATSMVGGGTALGAQAGSNAGANQYFVDSLFRSNSTVADPNDSSRRAETGLILANALSHKELAASDRDYVASLVSAKTGLSQPDAQNRVSQVYEQAREATDAARKAIAHSLFWIFLALLIGAFCASYAATIGGRQRDHVPAV